jgi:hypothetical protein
MSLPAPTREAKLCHAFMQKPWIITKDATLISSNYVDFNTSVCKGGFDPMLVNHFHVTH